LTQKLLAVTALGQAAYGSWASQQLLSRMIGIAGLAAGLAMVIAIMVSAILVASLYAAYFAMIQAGAEQHWAILITGMSALVVIVALVLLLLVCLRRLRRAPKTLLNQSPITARAMDTVGAFMDGLMEPR
jgi:amino acid transporter